MKYKILHTNDVHSRFENFARIVAKIKEFRDDNTLVLDAGDFNDFMRLELEGTDGRAGAELLHGGGYDAIAVGNNETFQGMEMLSKMASYNMLPFLSCNLYKSDFSSIEGLKRSIIIERGGVRFLIIGTSPELGIFYAMSGMGTAAYKDAIQKELDDNKDMYDVSVLLSHLGLREDRDIAASMKGIDIIIGGHSHILMDKPEVIGNTVIHQSGSFGGHLGVLEFDYENGIVSVDGYNINIEDVRHDAGTIELIYRSRELAIGNLGVPLYNIDRDLWHDVIEENPVTNLMADALRDVFDSDIGLINSGVLNGGIRKGPVSKKKLLEICPSPLNPTYMEVQGKDIRSALEKAMYADFCMQDGKGSGFRGHFIGRLHISGMAVYHDGRHIKRILVNGQELEDERWYGAATCDYLQRGTGYTSLSNNRNVRYDNDYLRDMLSRYLNREGYLKNAYIDRWVRI